LVSMLPHSVFLFFFTHPSPTSFYTLSLHDALPISAASRRSLGRVSVPVWLIVLSDQLPIEALVSRYLTNKLMGRGPLPMRKPKLDRKSTRLNSSHLGISYAVFCLKKKKNS